MRLYFLRHAQAFDGADDAARPLSPLGIKQCRKVARFLRRAEIQFDLVYSSPLVRAVQTAQEVVQRHHKDAGQRMEIVESLLNESDHFFDWVQELPDKEHILLVGHAPSLEYYVRRMVGIKSELHFSLPKAGLACVETTDRKTGSLKFFISAKVL